MSRARAGSKWAIARLAQCKQFKLQLTLTVPRPHDGLRPLVLHAIVWWDEHHDKCRLGHVSKYECLISRDAQGRRIAPKDGGKFPERKPTMNAKYTE